jgi:ABC-type lipoprotein release transport system permease subunit
MLMAALRHMQWRKRRFVIAVLSTAIIFAMTLVLTGLANGFRAEAQKTVDSLGVDVFLVKEGASGPFVGRRRSHRSISVGSQAPRACRRPLRWYTPAAL